MTKALQGQELGSLIQTRFPMAILVSNAESLWIELEYIKSVLEYLKSDEQLDFSFLNSISAVDYIDHFEVVYHLTSFKFNHSAVIKVKINGRDDLKIPSVVEIWPGANFQEREIWDLMGIQFENHPNLKRIMLWEGFPGHPHRKDFEDPVKY